MFAKRKLIFDQSINVELDLSSFIALELSEPRHEISNNVVCATSKVRKRTKIRNRYNQAPHLTQDTNGKVTT